MIERVSHSVGVSRKKGLGIDRKFHFSDLVHVNVSSQRSDTVTCVMPERPPDSRALSHEPISIVG